MRKNFPTRHWQDDAFSPITNTINRFCSPATHPCPLYSLDYLLTRIYHIPISWPLPVLFPHLKWAYHPLPHPDLVLSKGVLPAEYPSMEQQYGGILWFPPQIPIAGPMYLYLRVRNVSNWQFTAASFSVTGNSLVHGHVPSQSCLAAMTHWYRIFKSISWAFSATAGWWLLPVLTLPLSPPGIFAESTCRKSSAQSGSKSVSRAFHLWPLVPDMVVGK